MLLPIIDTWRRRSKIAISIAGQQDGIDIQAAMNGGQRWDVEASEIFCVKLMKKMGDFLQEAAQLTELAEQHLVSADHLLPPQRTPTNIVTPTAKQMVGDITSPLCTGRDIATDAEEATPAWIVTLPAQIFPPSISSKWSLNDKA